MSSDSPVAAAHRLFPPALVATIRDASPPDRGCLLAMARHFKRDLAPAHPTGLPARTAVRLGYRTLIGSR